MGHLKRHLRTQEQFEFCNFFRMNLSTNLSIDLPNFLYLSVFFLDMPKQVAMCWFVFFAIDFSLPRIQWPVQPKPEGAPKKLENHLLVESFVFFFETFPF